MNSTTDASLFVSSVCVCERERDTGRERMFVCLWHINQGKPELLSSTLTDSCAHPAR